ncbi:MAG: MBL fold metallo-hydrolase [Bythopirellula sp.]|nr:MBL fold metallo-hydrolase [Bythopirellula sp.]
MQLTIHRGTQEIGGTCIEIASGNSRILLDVGLPLFDAQQQLLDTRPFRSQSTNELLKSGIIPKVEGLTGGERLPDAILLSHAHLDHCGLLDRTSPQIPVYATSGTSKMMKAGSIFAGQVELPRERFRKLTPEQPTQIGNFRVTAYSVDHSIFGAVAILVEADGQSLLYSGDLRLHGRKTGMAKKLIKAFQNKKLDVLLMEGTHLGHTSSQQTTEYDLEDEISDYVRNAPSLVLASFSPQHVDRLVAFIRAAKKTGRTFIADVYTAYVLHSIASETKVPVPGIDENLPVFVPAILWANESKQRMIKKKFPQFLRARIEIDEILTNPAKYVMIFRPSMMESDFGGRLPTGVVCLHSRWEGYLDQPDAMEMKQAIEVAQGQLIQAHVSGHIRSEDSLELIRQLNPGRVIPVHTFSPEKLAERLTNVRLMKDREILQL